MEKVTNYAPYVYAAIVDLEYKEVFNIFVMIPLEDNKSVIVLPSANEDEESRDISMEILSQTPNTDEIISSNGSLYWKKHFSFDYFEGDQHADLEPENIEFNIRLKYKEEESIITIIYADAEALDSLDAIKHNDVALTCPYIYMYKVSDPKRDKEYFPKTLIPSSDNQYISDTSIMNQTIGDLRIVEGIIPIVESNSTANIQITNPININNSSFSDSELEEGVFSAITDILDANEKDDLAIYKSIHSNISNEDYIAFVNRRGRRGKKRKMKIRTKSADSNPLNILQKKTVNLI